MENSHLSLILETCDLLYKLKAVYKNILSLFTLKYNRLQRLINKPWIFAMHQVFSIG